MSAGVGLAPAALKQALIASATGSAGGWNRDFGHGIINAAAAYRVLRDAPVLMA